MSTNDEYSEAFYLFSDSDGEAGDALAALHDLSAVAENLATNGPNAPPPIDHTFPNLDQALKYCQKWARDHGYGLVVRSSRRDPKQTGFDGPQPIYEQWLRCEYGGQKRINSKKVAPENVRREKNSKKDGCPFKLKLSRAIRQPDAFWVISLPPNVHHACDAALRPATLHAHRRGDRKVITAEIKTLRSDTTMKAKGIYQAIKAKFPSAAITLKDIRNELQKLRDQTNKGYPVVQAMMRGLVNNPQWVFDYCYDEDNRLERVIFFHKDLIKLLILYPSVLILDATYKTNRFSLPLVNLCTMTATNETLLLGQAFVTHEEISDYTWVFQFYKRLCDQQEIPYPQTIISDRAGGILGAVPLVFPEAKHMLCIWHINKDVEAHCLKVWRRESDELVYSKQQEFAEARWNDLRDRWIKTVYAKTTPEFTTSWDALKYHYRDQAYQPIIQYLFKTWLTHKEMFVKAWTCQYLHFDNAATNRAEGINYSVKFDLPHARGSLQELLDGFKVYISGHTDKLLQNLENERTNRHTRLGKNELYNQCWGTVSHFAVKKVEEVRARYNLTYNDPKASIIPPCTSVMKLSMGLPCAHLIQQLMQQGKPLKPAHFHKQWRLDRLKKLPQLTILDLLRDPQQIPSRLAKRGKNKKKREESAFEIQRARQKTALGVRSATLGARRARSKQSQRKKDRQREVGVGVEVIHIESDTEDELAALPVRKATAQPHRQPTISDLLNHLSSEDELAGDSAEDSDSVSVVYDIDNFDEVRAGKRARIGVDDEEEIEELDL